MVGFSPRMTSFSTSEITLQQSSSSSSSSIISKDSKKEEEEVETDKDSQISNPDHHLKNENKKEPNQNGKEFDGRKPSDQKIFNWKSHQKKHILEPHLRYHGWRSTWWNGIHSIILSKIAFVSNYQLTSYKRSLDTPLLDFIDKHKNCEDIGLSFVNLMEGLNISHFLEDKYQNNVQLPLLPPSPPRWIKSTVYENAEVGISSGSSHFKHRSSCVTIFFQFFDWLKLPTSSTKFFPIHSSAFFNVLKLWRDFITFN